MVYFFLDEGDYKMIRGLKLVKVCRIVSPKFLTHPVHPYKLLGFSLSSFIRTYIQHFNRGGDCTYSIICILNFLAFEAMDFIFIFITLFLPVSS